MAERRRELHPDEMFRTRGGREIPIVSEQQIVESLARMGEWVNFAGGVVSLVVFRAPTDLPGEMVTVGGVVEWKDRTDARPQPEPTAEYAIYPTEEMAGVVAAAQMPDEQDEEPVEEPEPWTPEPEVVGPGPSGGPGEPAAPASDDDLDDGLGEDPDAVDESAIPEHSR